MNATTEKCPVCNSDDTSIQLATGRNTIHYVCPVCGRFELDWDITDKRDMNHLASYLFYNAFRERTDSSPRYYTELSEEYCAGERKKHSDEYRHLYRLPYHMDEQIVENWFPKSFSERVDAILLYLNARAKHVGASVVLSLHESFSLLFVDRKEKCEDRHSLDYRKMIWRDEGSCEEEAEYMLSYLSDSQLIQYTDGPSQEDAYEIVIKPKGYSRIDELIKNTSHGRNALVAMKFGTDTNALREAIRSGIHDAGYIHSSLSVISWPLRKKIFCIYSRYKNIIEKHTADMFLHTAANRIDTSTEATEKDIGWIVKTRNNVTHSIGHTDSIIPNLIYNRLTIALFCSLLERTGYSIEEISQIIRSYFEGVR